MVAGISFCVRGTGLVDASLPPITDGSVLLDNSGLIESTVGGQALDFDAIDSTGPGDVTIINRAWGTIRSANADAIRPGENAVVDNAA